MSDYLVTQAIQQIWCTPEQDRQAIVAPKKISRYGGVFSSVSVMWRNVKLPELGTLFHVYQIGQVQPEQIGLSKPVVPNLWVKFSDICIKERIIVDIYDVNGIQLPRYRSWYTVTEDGDLIVAIADTPKIPINQNTDQIYMRFYSNAYYNSTRVNSQFEFVDVQGMQVTTTADIMTMRNKATALQQKNPNGVYCFINGMRTSLIDQVIAKAGDIVEIVYDGAISSVVDFQIVDLKIFDSTLDQKRKYVLHPKNVTPTEINYNDDIDVWIYKKDSVGRFTGMYYHRNVSDALRNLTHNDYSIVVPYVINYCAHQGWDINECTIRLHIRKSGYKRPLIYETNRIRELYKLPDEDILDAIIGIDALVPEWQADHLESASYPKIMGSNVAQITPALAQDAFGYNSMCQYMAPTPQFTKLVSNQLLVSIPVNLRYRSTVYEYDFDGVLLGWYTHTLGDIWHCQNDNCHLVEIITGFATKKLDEKYGQAGASLDSHLDYRMYICNLLGGLPDNKWVDVTESNYYVLNGNQLDWVIDQRLYYTMVRSNLDFLGYDIDLPMQSGVLKFTLTSEQTRGGVTQNTIMQIPPGELDIFLNGHPLVAGLDYIADFPTYVITNKKFIDSTKYNQLITIRYCGHSKADFTSEVVVDTGFVTHGVLSDNNRFDLRDDKVLHINVGGAVYDRSELTFAENHSGVNVPGVPDGTPYSIRDIVVPMRGTTNAKTYALRDAALIVDKHVSDYMTMKLAPPVFTEISSLPELYPIYSPFCSSLIDDLGSGILVDERMYGQYNDNVVKDICKFYEPLLAFEPTYDAHKVDSNYVSVQPYYKDTVTEMDIFKYRFLSRAVALYLKNAVKLSHFIVAKA